MKSMQFKKKCDIPVSSTMKPEIPKLELEL